MKKTIIAATTLAAISAPVYAELEGDLSLSYHSQYNYRGANGYVETAADRAGEGDDATENAFETAINLSWKLNDQWSLVAGANITSTNDSGIDHNRYRGGIRHTNDCYHIELGYQRQDIRTSFGNNFGDNQGDIDTGEIYLNIGSDVIVPGIALNLQVARDLDELEGTYVELSGQKAWDVTESTSVALTVGVSYSFDYWENITGSGNDWNNYYITFSIAHQITQNLTLTPYVTFSQGFDALDNSSANISEGDEVTYGISASVNF